MLELKNSLLFSIIDYGQADRFVEVAKECGAGGATVFPAKGTASNSVLRMLGLGDTSKEVVLILSDDKVAYKILDRIREEGKIKGVSALIGTSGDKTMAKAWKMITIIANSGFADDIMETARKAGATGGTVAHARGTAPVGHEEHFLGVDIVPEKEMIMILSESSKTEDIVKAVKKMDCLKEKGVGIIYTQDVKDFANLGNAK